MFSATQYLRLHRNEKKEIKTPVIEFMKKNTDVTVENNGTFQKIAQYETGAMFVSPNGKYAVALIDGKGIQSYDSDGQADGLFANSARDMPAQGGIHQIALYDNGNALFKVFKGARGTHMSLGGNIFLTSDGSEVNFGQTLKYKSSEIATKADIESLKTQLRNLGINIS